MEWPGANSRESQRIEAWYLDADAAALGLSLPDFTSVLTEVAARYLPAGSGAVRRRAFFARLRLPELALARACARGHAVAWDRFYTGYRAKLHHAARAITRAAGGAEELADSLFADLYGLRLREGRRVSKFNSYMGVGSLDGWLYTLLAQAHVDHWRRERRQVSLEECEPLHSMLAPPNQSADGGLRLRLEQALSCVLERTSDQTRLLLSLYFLDGHTLAQIGQLLHVHESTISRRVDRLLVQLRRQTIAELRRLGVARPAANEALGLDPRQLEIDVRGFLRPHAGTVSGEPS